MPALLVVLAVGEPRPATPAREALAHHAEGLSTGRHGISQLLEDHPLLFLDRLVPRKKRLQNSQVQDLSPLITGMTFSRENCIYRVSNFKQVCSKI